MGGSATNSPVVQNALANLLDAAGGGLVPKFNQKPKHGIEKLMESYVANGERPDGMTAPGNLNLYKRPRVWNEDEGGVSTVYSEGRNVNGEEVLLPRVVGNKILSSDDALKHYLKTGEHLGKFSDAKASSDYAEALHLQQQALTAKPALDEYTRQASNIPDAIIRGAGDAVSATPDMAIAAGKLMGQAGLNPRGYRKQFEDTTYMPINPAVQDMLTRAGVAETEGANNLTQFLSSAMLPFAGGKYVGMVGDAIGAAERGAASRLRDAAMGPGDRYVYHTSPGKIASINSNGLFDDGLHFSNEPYVMTAAKNPTLYKMKVNDADYIPAQQIPYHDDYSKIDNVVKKIAKRYNVSDDVALDLISENKSIYNIDGIENYGDASWDIQRAALDAAKKLGYKGVIGNDEQGATYLTSMAGREKDLIDIASERGALSNAQRGMFAGVGEKDDTPYDRLKRKFKGEK